MMAAPTSLQKDIIAMQVDPSLASFVRKTLTLCAAGGALWVSVAAPVHAQSAACVNLLLGAGYAAWMGVHVGDSYHWSSSFPVGQSRCIKLPVQGMVNGAPYTVVVSAVLGSSKVPCTPEPSAWSSSNANSVSYNASGSSFRVKCRMPSVDVDFSDEPTTSPSEGIEALENWKKEGPKPAPQ
jgi:hypothetical protein